MHKRPITYTDYNDPPEEKTGIFYFYFSLPELTKMEMEEDGGLSKLLQRIIEEQDGKNINKMIETFVLDSFGYKTTDGEFFEKSEAATQRFKHSAAYEALFFELTTDAAKAGEFVNKVMPAAMIKKAQDQLAARQAQGAAAKAAMPASVEDTIAAMGGTPDPAPTPPPAPTGPSEWNPFQGQTPSATQDLGAIVPQPPPAPQR